jgi:hypothetical protein
MWARTDQEEQVHDSCGSHHVNHFDFDLCPFSSAPRPLKVTCTFTIPPRRTVIYFSCVLDFSDAPGALQALRYSPSHFQLPVGQSSPRACVAEHNFSPLRAFHRLWRRCTQLSPQVSMRKYSYTNATPLSRTEYFYSYFINHSLFKF